MAGTAWSILVYGVVPLWLLAGFADYLCHRRADIEHASGAREAVLHWLLLGEVGIPLLLAVFFKVDTLLFAVMILGWIAHEITTHIDLRLAIRTRYVGAFEQQAHSFLAVLPVLGIVLLVVLHPGQALALFGVGSENADFSLRLAPTPPLFPLIALGAGLLVFGLIPYADELLRGMRAAAKARAAQKVTAIYPAP